MFEKRKYIYAAVLVVLVAAAGLFYTRGNLTDNAVKSDNSFVIDKSGEDIKPTEQAVQLSDLNEPSPDPNPNILVHITGAVKNPGVYELEAGSRINDALAAAGGETDEADLERINLAGYAVDAQQIYVARKGEEIPAAGGTAQGDIKTGGLININTAPAGELTELPGIGEAMADAIIRYREQNGAFQKPEDMKNVARIGEKTYDSLKDLITVE